MPSSRSHHAVIRVYDETGNVIATDEYTGDSKSREADSNVYHHQGAGKHFGYQLSRFQDNWSPSTVCCGGGTSSS
jgi:hypothetical protein